MQHSRYSEKAAFWQLNFKFLMVGRLAFMTARSMPFAVVRPFSLPK